MQLEVNQSYSGFRLIEEKAIKETNSLSRIFVHEKSGARLLQMENDDDNKVFSITFRTPPDNSTGLPHILEHAVLCGSRKFPLKDPFVELVKGSLNTFLNAMTFSDKTMYPVASRNDKDFINLMDVYLDAVFYPRVYDNPLSFMQEGWYYGLESKDSEIVYKGIVYNEMKGAFSSPDAIIMRKVEDSLFPDTPYGKESGGDPDVIPELSYEEFIDFHKKYYHPANSFIYLYGNGNILEQLAFINDNYLKSFDKIEVHSEIPLQKPFEKRMEKVYEYPISMEDDEKGKSFLALNFAVGRSTNPELYIALELLDSILMGTAASPLKKALIDAELGKDVYSQFDGSILQPTMGFIIKHTDEDKKERFQQVAMDTLKKLSEEGIDKKLIEAAINRREFELREADFGNYPKGLIYNIKIMDSWLYGGEPTVHLQYEESLQKVKAALTTDYFEKLIKEYLLNNTHSTLVILKPKKGLSEEKAQEIKKRLAEYKDGLSESELNALLDINAKLKERQESTDSPEDLRKIPLLSRADIDTKAEKVILEERQEQGIKMLYHPIFTNNIAYVHLLFDSANVEQELVPYVSLLTDILGKVSTEKYDYMTLSNEVNIHTGGIRSLIHIYGDKEKDDEYQAMVTIRSKALVSKLPKLIELLSEVVGHTVFDDKKRLKELIQEMKSKLEAMLLKDGAATVARRLHSYYSQESAYLEITSGIAYYKFVADLEKNFDSKADALIANFKKIAETVFNKENLYISLTCDEKDYGTFKEHLPTLLGHLGDKTFIPIQYEFDITTKNEGLITQGKVQYNGKGANFKQLGSRYTGIMQVLTVIARYEYMWNKIRIQGGAYGTATGFKRGGNMHFVSYRDPNLAKTLAVFDEFADYIRSFDADEREMTKYVIGTISNIDSPLTPVKQGDKADECYFRQITSEDLQRERDEILNVTREDVIKLADVVEKAMKKNYVCVMGSEATIKENKHLFDCLLNVIE